MSDVTEQTGERKGAGALWRLGDTTYRAEMTDRRNICDDDNEVVAIVPWRSWDKGCIDNARLITVAPDLYIALEALRKEAVALIGAVLSRDNRQMLIAANKLNTSLPASGKLLAKARDV